MINKEIKKLSREQLKGNWWKFVLYTLVIFLISGTPTAIFGLDNNGVSINIVSIILTIIIAVFTIGLYLNFVRTKEFNLNSGIKNWKVYLRFLGMYVIIFLISMLIMMIPMALFIAIFSDVIVGVVINPYAMNLFGEITTLIIIMIIIVVVIYTIINLFFMATPYLLVDNVTIGQSISKSFALMKRNKWRLFKLEISFIGWFLLGIITLGIGFLWVIPYFTMTITNFYTIIRDENKDLI